LIAVFLASHAPGFETGAVAFNGQDSTSGFQRGHPLNTTGNRNRDIDEPVSLGHRLVIGLIRLAVPPHADNERAADFLRKEIGQGDSALEWCVVRPDSLVNEPQVTEHEVHPSPIRSAIFDAGKTSRSNIAHFMAGLMTDDESWRRWQGQMPVIYNKTHA
jgi:hypothetical protein